MRQLKKLPRQTVHELGREVQWLTRLAYPNMNNGDREEMALETFLHAFDDKAIRRFQLLSPASTVNEAIQKADEYFQAGDHNFHKVSSITETDSGPQETETTKAEQIPEVLAQTLERITNLTQQ